MLIQEAVRRLVLANSGVTDIIGQRMFPGYLSQSVAEPAIAYRTSKDPSEYSMDAEDRGVTGPTRHRFGFFSTVKGLIGDTSAFQRASLLDDALRNAIDGFQGEITDGGSPVSTFRILGIFHEGTDSLYDDRTSTHQFLSVYEVVAEEQRPN